MARTPKAAPLGGFNVSGPLGDMDAGPLASNSTLFDAGPLSLPPFSSGLALPQSLGGFTPASISGLDLWLRADLGVTLNGSNVSAWADQSGNNRNCSQASAPAQPGGPNPDPQLNGQPALLFSALQSLAGPTALTAGVREIWFVLNLTDLTAGGIFTNKTTTQWSMHISGTTLLGLAGLIWSDGVNNPNNSTLVAPLGVLAPHIYHYIEPLTPAHLSFYLDGSMTNTVSAQLNGMSTETGADGYVIGKLGVLNGIIGKLAEIISYNRFLTVNETTLVNSYLKSRYGFP